MFGLLDWFDFVVSWRGWTVTAEWDCVVERLDRHDKGLHCEDPVCAWESLEDGTFQQFAEASGEDVSSCVCVYVKLDVHLV